MDDDTAPYHNKTTKLFWGDTINEVNDLGHIVISDVNAKLQVYFTVIYIGVRVMVFNTTFNNI